jgi:DNA invertase Pin-like site-specific DNA recombinase
MSITTITKKDLNLPDRPLTKLEKEQLAKTSFTFEMKKKKGKKNNNGKRRIAVYKRISHLTDQSVTFERQHMELMNFLKSQGIDINDPNIEIVVFEETASAYKNIHRSVLQNMVERIKAGEFTDVAFYDIDRLARNHLVAAVLDDIFKEAEVTVWVTTLGKSIDTNTLEGGIIWNIMSMMAAQASLQTSMRTTGGHQLRCAAGVKRNSTTPFGLKTKEIEIVSGVIGGVRKVYALDTDVQDNYPTEFNNKAAVVKEVYRKYNDGQSFKSIARWMNNNIPTLIKRCEDKSKPVVYTKSWDDSTIKYMLKNPVYFGGSHYKGEIVTDKNGDFLITNEPLVTSEYWINTQALITSNTRNYKKRQVRYTRTMSPLHYIAKCSCGGQMKKATSEVRGTPFFALRCIVPSIDKSLCSGVSISQIQLEKEIFGFTKDLIADPEMLKKFIGSNNKPTEEISISPEEQRVIDDIAQLKLRIDTEQLDMVKQILITEVANKKSELNKLRMSTNIVINKVKSNKLTVAGFEAAWNSEDKSEIIAILATIYKSIIISKSTIGRRELNLLKKEGYYVDPKRVTLEHHDGSKIGLDDPLLA